MASKNTEAHENHMKYNIIHITSNMNYYKESVNVYFM